MLLQEKIIAPVSLLALSMLLGLGLLAYILPMQAPVVNKNVNTADPTADWAVYINEKYEFSFKYPSDWQIESEKYYSEEEQTLYSTGSLSLTMRSKDSQSIFVLGIDTPGRGASNMNNKITYKKNGDQLTIVNEQGYIDSQQNNPDKYGVVAVADKDYENGFFFQLIGPIADKSIIETTAHNMLSTFKFTDPTADWKTYTNEKYGYQYKYPSNWVVSSVDKILSVYDQGIRLENGDFKQEGIVSFRFNDTTVENFILVTEKNWREIYGLNTAEYNTAIINQQQEQIADNKVTHVTRRELMGGNSEWYFFSQSPGFYISSDSDCPTCQMILSTFKFTDNPTADWETYTSNQLGLEFKYPKEWGPFTELATDNGDNPNAASTGKTIRLRPESSSEIIIKCANESFQEARGATESDFHGYKVIDDKYYAILTASKPDTSYPIKPLEIIDSSVGKIILIKGSKQLFGITGSDSLLMGLFNMPLGNDYFGCSVITSKLYMDNFKNILSTFQFTQPN